jgi:methyl-accepting chemotaxis protein
MRLNVMSRLRFVHKVVLMPVVAAIGFAVILAMVLRDSSHNSTLMQRIYKGHIPALDTYRFLQETLATIQRGLQDAAASADMTVLADQDALRDAFTLRARDAKNIDTIDPVEMERLTTTFRDYYSTARDTTAKLIRRESGESTQASLERMRTEYVTLRDTLQTLTDKGKREAKDAFEEIIATQRRAAIMQGVVTLFALAVLIVLSVSLVVSLSKPLAEVTDITRRLAEGDLTRRVETTSTDEMGQMGASLNEALTTLATAIRSIGENSQALSAAAEELNAVSVEMAASAEQTSGQAEIASTASEQVSQNAQTVATGVEEMTASIRDIARNAHQAAKVATDAVQVTETTNQTIAKLSQSSAQISSVVKTITSIAEQTKLLALNATIEAARAGDAGRGFVVVANEVKELARATGKATEEIADRIAAIQSDASEAVAAIGLVGNTINQIYDSQNAIASAVEEQTATANEIARSIADAARASAEIATNLAGLANAAQRTSSGASATREAAAELARMAEVLRSLVVRFQA